MGDPVRKAGEPLDFIPPTDEETCELKQIVIPRPIFHSGPIEKEKMERNIIHRNSKEIYVDGKYYMKIVHLFHYLYFYHVLSPSKSLDQL